MRRRWKIALVLAAPLALVACQPGTPDGGFNTGVPAKVDTWPYDTNAVVRFADGGTLVSRNAWTEPEVMRLLPNGTPDPAWDTNGIHGLFQWGPSSSGFSEGTALPDGSVILYGGLDRYATGAVRLTPTGSLDPTYGPVQTADLFNGTGYDACSLDDKGTVGCAKSTPSTIGLAAWDASGHQSLDTSVPVNFGQFVPSPPAGIAGSVAHTDANAFVGRVEFGDGGVLISVEVSVIWRDAGFSYLGSASRSIMTRINGGGVDASFATNGYFPVAVNLDAGGQPIVGGGTSGPTGVSAMVLDADGSATLLLQRSSPTRSVLARLTPAGALDPTFSGDGLVAVDTATGAHVNATLVEDRNGAALTVAGAADTGVPNQTQGVVLRYTPAGVLDTAFSDDGVASLAGVPAITGLDVRNKRVTIAGVGDLDPDTGAAKANVSVLYG